MGHRTVDMNQDIVVQAVYVKVQLSCQGQEKLMIQHFG